VDLLRHHHVQLLVDVRTVPASRRMPHFAKSALERWLPAHGIAYRHMPELGGLRKPQSDSTNLGWRNVSFRGYADYMQTDAFREALAELERLAATKRVAVMCAEAVPWRCHRSLIADALVVDGVEVRHITGMQEPPAHRLTPFAHVAAGRVTYPPPDTLPL
jgi:uncharacterized protein (DUF488 family)